MKFQVTHEDGTVSTRSSKTKIYTHAVEVFDTNWDATEPTWGVLRWSQTEQAARKAAEGFRKVAHLPEWQSARVVEVEAVDQ